MTPTTDSAPVLVGDLPDRLCVLNKYTPGPRGYARPDVKTSDLVEAYANGNTLTAVANRYGISRAAVKRRLFKAGVVIRTGDKARRGPTNGRWAGESPCYDTGGQRARARFKTPEPCFLCGSTDNPTRHHRDHDASNNDASNIAWLCRSCHSRYHRAVELVARVRGESA